MPYHYDSQNYDPSATYEPELIPPGDYLCKVEEARWGHTQSGYEAFTLELAVKGYSSKLWYTVTCKCDTPEEKKKTDQWVGSVFAAFGTTPDREVRVEPLIGRVGGVHVSNRTYDGKTRSRAAYLLRRQKALELSQGNPDTALRTPQSTSTRTTGPGGKPGFDRYGDTYPLDVNDMEPPAPAGRNDEADIPF